MKRRDFLAAATGSSTYSVFVSPGDLNARPHPGESVEAGKPASSATSTPATGVRLNEQQEPHMALVDLDCDVLVAGGGLAGIIAAISAARHGARVVLVQDRSRLGGNSSSEVKMHVVGASNHKGRPGWREGGILEELRLDDAVNNPQRCWELWDLLLYDKVISEKNLRLLLDTTVFSAETREGAIVSVLARCDRSEQLYRIQARLFCDCTGDGRLGLEAGADFRVGHEAQSETGESMAEETGNRLTQGCSILFTSRDFGRPMPFKPPAWARKIGEKELKFRPISSWEYGYWWIEWGGHLDTIRDLERIRFELLGIVLGTWDYIKNSGRFPSAANWALDWVGMMPGKRESRRLLGDHVLTEMDLKGQSPEFEDAVCIGGWNLDEHPPTGFEDPDLPPFVSIRLEEVYGIPLRSLYSRNIRNLFMAGRNISASHVAFSSTRVMGTCAVEGQAIGTASALCIREGLLPRSVFDNKTALRSLQQILLRDDQTLKGVRNEDPLDLARSARIVASGHLQGSPPESVVNGWTRSLPGSSNQWAASVEQEAAWLELSWEDPQMIREIQLTFDTGFERELTLSSSSHVNQGIIRAPQPETVRKYRLQYQSDETGKWIDLVLVEDNYQRLRRHRCQGVPTRGLRVVVEATNGDPLARIFEVRCYA